MKTTVKTIALASIIVFGTASAFAKPANGNDRRKQEKVVTTTTVKTTTTTKVKEQPKKVHQAELKKAEKPAPVAKNPAPKHEAKKECIKTEHKGKRNGPNYRRQLAEKHADAKFSPKSECKKEPVAKHKPEKIAPKPVAVVTKVEKKPSCSGELDGKSLAAGAIVGGIIALTAIAACN